MITEQEKQYLIQHYGHQTGYEIADALGKKPKWVYQAVKVLRLKQTPEQRTRSRQIARSKCIEKNAFVPIPPEPLWPVPSLALAAKTRLRAVAEVRGG